MGLLELEGESVSRKAQGGVSVAWGLGLKLQALGEEREERPTNLGTDALLLATSSQFHSGGSVNLILSFAGRRPSRVKDLFRVLESKETGNS